MKRTTTYISAKPTLTQRELYKKKPGLKNYLLRLTVRTVWCTHMYLDTTHSQIRCQSEVSSITN